MPLFHVEHKPLSIDLFCGLGGWTEGLLAEGYEVVGFDIERHQYGDAKYPAQLVLQDVLTLHGKQFKSAALIVASPPCQAYSYRAMPWKRAKALPPPDNTLFEACFRIQREACKAAGRHIPLVVENVRGAQKWVGRARWSFGSFYLWGDVPALMPIASKRKVPGFRFDGSGRTFQTAAVEHTKNSGGSWFNVAHNTTSGCGNDSDGRKTSGLIQRRDGHGHTRHLTNPDEHTGLKVPGIKLSQVGFNKVGSGWFGKGNDCSPMRKGSSKSDSRKSASAMIAKIPFVLSSYIGKVFYPSGKEP